MSGTTEQLARFVTRLDRTTIPKAVRHQAIRCLVNWAACATGSGRHPAVCNALAALRPFVGPAQAGVLGTDIRVDALHAALLNGISSHVQDFDDTHLATLVHPSGPVLSALLALTETRPVDGSTFLDALICGIEVECRIGLGISPEHYDAGWHITSTVGGFGAAAAAGRVLMLDEMHMAWALSIAATQASGVREMFGTMCKSLHPGMAAQHGLRAAFLAAAEFTSSTQGIEAPRGFARVLSTRPHLEDSVKGLGAHWEILANSFKPYACGLVIHPVIDACLTLHRHPGFELASIEEVMLDVHPLVLELTGKLQPQTGLEGKFSVFHAAAASLIDGIGDSRQFTDAAVQDPATISLRAKVRAQAQSGIREDEARVAIVLKDGRRLEHHVEHALGSIHRPMSDRDLDRKFRSLVHGILPEHQVQEALDMCWSIDSLPNAAVVAKTLMCSG